jgi:hypothetical protein
MIYQLYQCSSFTSVDTWIVVSLLSASLGFTSHILTYWFQTWSHPLPIMSLPFYNFHTRLQFITYSMLYHYMYLLFGYSELSLCIMFNEI